jgi:translocation protein SEC63
MAALKGQPTADPNKPKKVRKPAQHVQEESDYESGTDEDEESESETDTDTDTDDE